MLTNSDINELVAFRRHLHRRPELSGEEEWTAAEIAGALDRLRADVSSALGDTKAFTDTVESLAVTRQANAKPLYKTAFATGTPWTVDLQNILQRPIMRTLVERARLAGEPGL